MTPSTEFLLMAGVLVLYIYDSMLLLYCNEGILSPAGKNGWTVHFGSNYFPMFGKEPFVPNPFLLHRPLFRLSWQFEGQHHTEKWTPQNQAFSVLVPMVWIMMASLFIILPLGLFTRLGDNMIVVALVVFYSTVIVALLWVWRKRSIFRCSEKRFAGLAFESVICPPFALNLVRHLSANIPVPEDLVCATRRLQRPSDWLVSRAEFLARIEHEIEWEEEDSGRRIILIEHHRMLTEEGESCLARKS